MKILQLIKQKRPLIMGILNLTPDSFSDGGKFNNLKSALKRAKEIEKQGADILDIGGEGTGPKSKNISLEEELKRVIPILKILRKHIKIPISIDTYKSEVAKQALENGADLINDVTALRGDKKMAEVIAKYGCPVILMYAKDSTARTTIKNKQYKDVIKAIKDFLKTRVKYAKKAGIKNIIIDPGMGHFVSSLPQYSLEIISRLKELKFLKYPILIGISRKSFLGGEIKDRDKKALPLTAIAVQHGASIIRTHNVKATVKICQQCN